jgi:hypothetical protein
MLIAWEKGFVLEKGGGGGKHLAVTNIHKKWYSMYTLRVANKYILINNPDYSAYENFK